MGKDVLNWGDLYYDNTGRLCKFFNPHAGQLAILQSDARFLLALGGVNGGKTSLAMLWLCKEISDHKFQGTYLVVGPTQKTVSEATFVAWKNIIDKWAPYQGKAVMESGNLRFVLNSGATVFFSSAESDLVGMKPNAVVLDEGGLISVEVYRECKKRLMDSGGKLLVATTPYLSDAEWLRSEIIDEADAGHDWYFYQRFSTLDNPKMAADPKKVKAIEDEKRTLPDWEFRMKYLGEFSRPASQVYDLYSADNEPVFIDLEPDEFLPYAEDLYGAIDLGGADPTCLLVGLLDHENCLWIIGEHYKKSESVITTIEAIEKIDRAIQTRHHKVRFWWCDHRPDVWKTFSAEQNKHGLTANVRPASKGKGSIELGIGLVRSRIRKGKLKVLKDKCPNLYKEMQAYRYSMREGEVVGCVPAPRQMDHALDALRYMVLGIDRRHRPRGMRQEA